jgi:hypothetical protein
MKIASGPSGISYVRFPARQLGVFIDHDGLGPNLVRPHTASEVLKLCPAAEAVLDGPMFEIADRGADYVHYHVGRLDYRYLDTHDGDDADGGTKTDRRGATLSVIAPGNAVWFDGDVVAPNALVAVQGYPALVRAGVIVASAAVNRSNVWRAGFGTIVDDVVLAVGVGSMVEFAAAMLALGCMEAAYTDGGGSTRLAVREKGVPSIGSSENRRVASFLTCEPRRNP